MFNQIDLFKKDIEFVENMFRKKTEEKKIITETNHSPKPSGEGFATLLEDLNTISSNVDAISIQEAVDHHEFLKELNEKVYGGALKIPSVKYITSSRADYLGRAVMKVVRTVATGDTLTSVWIEIQKRALADDELHKSILAHESIHIYQYQNMEPQDQVRYARGTLNFDGHGSTFTPWMEKINAIYGKDFVTVKGEYTDKTPSKYFYAVLAKSKNDERTSVGTFMKMTPKIRQSIERIHDLAKRSLGYSGMKVIRTNDDVLLQASVVSQGMSIFTDKDVQEKLKKLYDESETEIKFSEDGKILEAEDSSGSKVKTYDDEDSTFIYIEESNNEEKSDFEEQAPPMQSTQSPQADIQKAEGKKLAMGRKANDWLRKLNQFSTNASKEVASGNIGTAASDFFEMIAEMPKQDWYKHFFKV